MRTSLAASLLNLSRDPDFGPKVGNVLDLYARAWDGEQLGEGDYVISADEKSQLQTLHRRHPALPPGSGPGRAVRIEFEYSRSGTLAYFAACDVHRGRVMGTIAAKIGIVPFMQLVGQEMRTEPYASAHQPVHASWLNQLEIHFSIRQRMAITCADFPDLDTLAARIMAFQEYYNTTAEPFDWNTPDETSTTTSTGWAPTNRSSQPNPRRT